MKRAVLQEAVAALLLAAAVICRAASAGEFQIVLAGDCPGEEIVTIASATPGGLVEVYRGNFQGPGAIPGGPCAGIELGLAEPELLVTVTADETGGFSTTVTAGAVVCGRLLRTVDLTSCGLSNLARLSSGHPALVPQTGQDSRYHSKDDGALKKGVPWPEPRFTVDGDGTVRDNLTGLIWLRNADCFGSGLWDQALAAANGLADGQCGLTDGSEPGDWRLPNVLELVSLIDYGEEGPALPDGHPFVRVPPNVYYLSSSTDDTFGPRSLYLDTGIITIQSSGLAWPVRGAAPPGTTRQAPAPVQRTGQDFVHGVRDDGFLRQGTAWPDPRFTDRGDGTVKDSLTGLIWLRDASCSQFSPFSDDWLEVLDAVDLLGDGQCGLTDGSQLSDWRLPNLRELLSLIDYGEREPALPPGNPFVGVEIGDFTSYWSSSTVKSDSIYAHTVTVTDGAAGFSEKEDQFFPPYVWPVRDEL